VTDPTPTTSQVDDLDQRAGAARARCDYAEAASLYGTAAAMADTSSRRLHLLMRAAHCHAAMDARQSAEEIAQLVATEAREEFLYAQLADALSVIVDSHMLRNELAPATQVLAEAMYVMELVPDLPENYQVIHNMGDTYLACQFAVPALDVYGRALSLVSSDLDRAFTLASCAAAHHLVANFAPDDALLREHLDRGLAAASEALGIADAEVLTRVTSLAHRAGLLNMVGQHAQALDDALEARHLADLHHLPAEEGIAKIGEAIARWHLDRDASVLDLIADAANDARPRGTLPYMRQGAFVAIDILWAAERYDDARWVMEFQNRTMLTMLHSERDARWEHVRLGVSYRTTAALSESDPLTGLPNRRYLGHWLPEVLDQHGIVCVGVLDLDGFKQVNDVFSYGHGDRVLQQLAAILQKTCRRGDAVVRLGGDEFVLVLRETSPGDARGVLDRVRQLIGATVWDGLPANRRLTASVGVAVGSGASDAARVLATAGEALRAAKKAGRDRIVFR
jgi:diguanylate cyclase (GGDEF)-like protein